MKRILFAIGLACWAATLHAAALKQLDWLAGHWITEDGAAEEGWFAPKGGAMPGLFRWVMPEGRTVLEYLVIEDSGDGLTLRFKHYNPQYEPWEADRPNTYVAREIADDSVTFERDSDAGRAPVRIRYWREGEVLHFLGEGKAGEEPLRLTFRRY